MTVYSQHAQRGKVQILANFRGADGVISSTVTSVESAKIAAPIVDALNRISACATVPVSVYDIRDARFKHYPDEHLAVLTDRHARTGLLDGAHSLWYVQAMWLLHEALTDLDEATASLPSPIRTALDAELETEARWLRSALAEYTEGVELPGDEARRLWDFEEPFVAFDGGLAGLGSAERGFLNRLEAGITAQELEEAVQDLRLLLDVDAQHENGDIRLDTSVLVISAEPEDLDGYYLTVQAPPPGGEYNRTRWSVSIDRWEVDEWDADGDPTGSHGEAVVSCDLPERPIVREIVDLLNLCTSQKQLEEWSRTPVGERLVNTPFVVTERFDETPTEPE